MKSALFLGAGASRFVSHPTTKELLTIMNEHIRNSNMAEDEKIFVLELLRLDPDLNDIEKVYDCINYMIDVGKHNSRYIVNRMEYRMGNVRMNYQQIVSAFKTTKSIIRNVLLTSFSIEPEKIPEIKAMYDGIWSIIQGNGSNAFQIITTNYDQVIERYCDEDWELVNGFHLAPNLQPNYWNNKWHPSTDKQSLHLVKLHGSIAWQKDGGRIRQADVPGIRNSNDDIMILPTLGSKDYKKPPFYELRERFEKILNDIEVLVIIGFSYRDPEINEMINKRMRKGMIVISISPEPNQVREISERDGKPVKIQGLPFSRFGAGIFAYEKEFSPNTLEDICNAINAIYKELQHTRK